MLLDIQKMTMGAQELQQGSFLADFTGEEFLVGFALKAPASAAYRAESIMARGATVVASRIAWSIRVH